MTAIAASVPDPSQFRSGRQFAAWLCLTPRACSSGGEERQVTFPLDQGRAELESSGWGLMLSAGVTPSKGWCVGAAVVSRNSIGDM